MVPSRVRLYIVVMAALLAALCRVPLGAQEIAEPPTIEVEVVGESAAPPLPLENQSLSPTPVDVVTVVTSEELVKKGAQTLFDALEYLPGYWAGYQGRRISQQIYLRGYLPAMVLVDGMRINSTAQPYDLRALESMPLAVVDRIEVIRNASSLIYGPEALVGGAVNIITRNGSGPSQAHTEVRNATYKNWRAGWGQTGGGEQGRYLAWVQRDQGRTNLPWSWHRFDSAFTKAGWDLRQGRELTASFWAVDGYRQLDQWTPEFAASAFRSPMLPPVEFWTIKPWREHYLNLDYHAPLKLRSSPPGRSHVDLRVWNAKRSFLDDYFADPLAPAPPPASGRLPTVTGIGHDDGEWGADLRFQWNPQGRHLIRSGLQWDRLSEDETTFQLPFSGIPTSSAVHPSRRTFSVFAQDEMKMRSGGTLFFGARNDAPSDRRHATVWAAGIEQPVGQRAQFYLHTGNGRRFPSFEALETNPSLQDQTSLNLDVGLRGEARRIWWSAGYFRSALRNDFVSYLRPGAVPPISPRDYLTANADQTFSGLEFELRGRLSSSLRWTLNHSRLRRTVDRTPLIEGRPLALAEPPRQIWNVALYGYSKTGRWSGALYYQRLSDQTVTAGYLVGAVPVSRYAVANGELTYRLRDGARLSFYIYNIFNRDYETMPGFPRPGRSYALAWTLGGW